MSGSDQPIINLTADSLMAGASKKVQLSDWGNEDFRRPLEVLLDSFQKEDDPLSTRLLFFRNDCLRLLSNRLLVQNDLRQFPEITSVPIRRPLFIIGLGRTGSTLLHNLLALNPDCRALSYWEMIRPSPPPDSKTRATDPRIGMAEKQLENLYRSVPELLHRHEIRAEWPGECHYLIEHTFMCMSFYTAWRVPSYIQWLDHQDMTPAYQYYRTLLQLLSWRTPGKSLALKGPNHLANLGVVLNIFPDANFVWTHRDPLKAIPSYYSLISPVNIIPVNEVKGEIKFLARNTITGMRVRDQYADPGKFLDVYYDELIQNPVSVAQRIYQYFNYDFNPGILAEMNDWLQKNQQNKHGMHKYSLADFGLDSNEIRAQFAPYYQRFGV